MTEAITTTGVLENVDPGDLQIENNVRIEASLTKQFITSIKENGVLVPIVAIRDGDGKLWVRAGQRRTLAAREAGLASVPVYVTNADVDTATRLVQQITENDQRLALTNTDRVQGIQQLLDTGMSVTKVAKRLAVSPERIKQSKAVAGSPTAMTALAERTATLAEAAGIAEFEGDEDAVRRLLYAASRGYFDQELERLQREKAEAAEREAAAEPWRKQGYEVVEGYPGYDSGMVPLYRLRTAEGDEVDQSAVGDPTRWAVRLSEESRFTDMEGNPVDEQLIDWATENDPEAQAAEGMIHVDSVIEKTEWVPAEYYCLDPEAEGLAVEERYAKMVSASGQLTSGEALETAEDLQRKAEEKAERRRVIALNKAGEAAEAVRRKFVANLLKRKTPPKGAALFVAQCLTKDANLLGFYNSTDVASELLGGSVRSGELLDHANDARAEVVVLGMTLGALESLTPKSAWRGSSDHTVAYLRFLAENGYGLSPVEQVMVKDKTAVECYEELA